MSLGGSVLLAASLNCGWVSDSWEMVLVGWKGSFPPCVCRAGGPSSPQGFCGTRPAKRRLLRGTLWGFLKPSHAFFLCLVQLLRCFALHVQNQACSPRGSGPLLFHGVVELRKMNRSKFCVVAPAGSLNRGVCPWLGWNVQHHLLQRQSPLLAPHRGGTPPEQGLGVVQPCPC